jgi:hypothetical protein
MSMKRRVSLGASLVAAVALAALAAGCSGKPPGKADLAQACMQRMGGIQPKCDCYVASVEQALSPEQFKQLAQGVRDYSGYSGDWLPNNVSSVPAISTALHQATLSCLTSA